MRSNATVGQPTKHKTRFKPRPTSPSLSVQSYRIATDSPVRVLPSQHQCGVQERRSKVDMAIEARTQPMSSDSNVATDKLFKRKGPPMPRSSAKTFSLAFVASHSTPTDCWVVVRNKVYDVTAWVPQHPGGALIYINAGNDCTQLFDSYHPLYARYQSCTSAWLNYMTLCSSCSVSFRNLQGCPGEVLHRRCDARG